MERIHKIPRSVLVIIHTTDLQILLLERLGRPGYWQSVTGSQHEGEPLEATARREVREETGLDTGQVTLRDWRLCNEYKIFSEWRWRYAPGVTRNTEHVFSLEVPRVTPVTLSPQEHSAYRWADVSQAAPLCFSWSNRDALTLLPRILRLPLRIH